MPLCSENSIVKFSTINTTIYPLKIEKQEKLLNKMWCNSLPLLVPLSLCIVYTKNFLFFFILWVFFFCISLTSCTHMYVQLTNILYIKMLYPWIHNQSQMKILLLENMSCINHTFIYMKIFERSINFLGDRKDKRKYRKTKMWVFVFLLLYFYWLEEYIALLCVMNQLGSVVG